MPCSRRALTVCGAESSDLSPQSVQAPAWPGDSKARGTHSGRWQLSAPSAWVAIVSPGEAFLPLELRPQDQQSKAVGTGEELLLLGPESPCRHRLRPQTWPPSLPRACSGLPFSSGEAVLVISRWHFHHDSPHPWIREPACEDVFAAPKGLTAWDLEINIQFVSITIQKLTL